MDTRADTLIVGGGASAALLVLALLRRGHAPERLAWVGREETFGRGLAWSTRDPRHLLNVHARHMSPLDEDPDAFADSLEEGEHFGARMQWAAHLESRLREAFERGPPQLFGEEAVDLERRGAHWRVRTRKAQVDAPQVVLATGHERAPWPAMLQPLGQAGLCVDALFDPLPDFDDSLPVLLLGTGLTMVDTALSLARRPKLSMLALSRHGLLPQPHARVPTEPRRLRPPSGSLRTLMRWLREECANANDWRAVVDALRPYSPMLWQQLSPVDRRRFLRHARRHWEIHRHRMAPQVQEQIAELVQSGRLRLHAGSLLDVEIVRQSALAAWRPRGARFLRFERVSGLVRCTGPSWDLRSSTNPLLCAARDRGHISGDPLGLGLRATMNAELLDAEGRPSPGLYAMGPLLVGSRWESTAIPEIRAQAAELARTLSGARFSAPGATPAF